ncbi:MAG: valine--tRNA ligase, partial [Thermoplasmatota archaeon]
MPDEGVGEGAGPGEDERAAGEEPYEQKWLDYWHTEKIFAFDAASPQPVFSIDTPPPTVSGKMHIGHAYSFNQMDFIARYKRMRGFNVFYPWGFDDNGLPTERLTERETGKRIHDVGRAEFVRLCLAETKKQEAAMEASWRRIGMSCDFEHSYRTIDQLPMRVSQLSFVELFAAGRAYRAERPTIWCPECATAIAQVEIEDRELPSTFNDVAFDVVGGPVGPPGAHLVHKSLHEGHEVTRYQQGAEGKIVISTTRPELIPACVAIFIHPDDPRTTHLRGAKVRIPLTHQEVPVLESDKVDKETGTGVVMCCTFGDQVDIEWWQTHRLPLRVALDANGRMTRLAPNYAGLKIDEARSAVKRDLDLEGRLLGEKKITHAVGVHERCGTPIEFLVTKQWFVKYLDLKEQFLARGEAVNWHPAYMRVRYENWVKGLKWDWCISRQRYFGIPFPVWYCKACGEPRVATAAELPVDPTQTAFAGPCAACGGREFTPEADVMDTWATSSLTPQIAVLGAAEWIGGTKHAAPASLHDLATDPTLAKLYPMSLRAQAHEIISFWAFNTIVKSHFHHDAAPWRDIMISGFVKLGKGKKMSKSKGNIVEPLEVISEFGADALRYWSATGATLGEDIIWNPKDLTRARRLVTKLRNIEGFVLKACGEGGAAPPKPAHVAAVDAWVLSEFARVVAEATTAWDEYEYTRALKASEDFLWHTFADNYLEVVKHRLYGAQPDQAARWTLYTVGLGMLKLFAPVLSFATEEVYQNGFRARERARSVHLAAWPEPPHADAHAAKDGQLVVDVVAAVRAWKSAKKLPLNEEIPAIEVVAPGESRRALEAGTRDIVGTTRAVAVSFVSEREVSMVPVAVTAVKSKL